MNQTPSETALKSGDCTSKLDIGSQSTHKSNDATRHTDCVPSQIYAHPSVDTAVSHCSAIQNNTIVNNSDEKAEEEVQSTQYVIKRIRTPSGKRTSPCQIEDDDSPNSVDTSDASKFKIGSADKPLTFDDFLSESKLQKTGRWRAKKRLLDDSTITSGKKASLTSDKVSSSFNRTNIEDGSKLVVNRSQGNTVGVNKPDLHTTCTTLRPEENIPQFDTASTASEICNASTATVRPPPELHNQGKTTLVSTRQVDNANTPAIKPAQIDYCNTSTVKTSQLGNANKPAVKTTEPDNLIPPRTNIPQLGCADRPDADNARPLVANEQVSGDCWDRVRISQL